MSSEGTLPGIDRWNPGLLSNMPQQDVTRASIVLTSGTLLVTGGITVPANRWITSVTFLTGSTLATSPTHWWFTIMNAGRVTQRSTADQTSTAWAANTAKTVNLTSPWAPTVDTAVYVGIMVVASPMPTLAGAVALENAAVANLLAVPYCGASSTAQTTAPADGTTMTAVTAGVDVPYCHLS